MNERLDIDPDAFEDGKVEKLNCYPAGDRYRLHMYSPQFGGYVGRLFIDVPVKSDSGCFDGVIFHDGDFPGDRGHEFHCCDATQFVKFGLKVYNQLCKLQDGEVDREYLLELRAEIDKMLEKP